MNQQANQPTNQGTKQPTNFIHQNCLEKLMI